MFIPFSYTVKYKNYPDAPKASRKSKILGYVTAWPFALIVGLQVWNVFKQILITRFNGESAASSFIAGLMAIIIYGLFLRFMAFINDITDKQAVIEAHTNNFSQYYLEIEKIKSDVKRESMIASVILAATGLVFGALDFWSLPHNPRNLNYLAENELRAGNTYYVQELYVIGAYAQDDKGKHKYYAAVFSDKDDKTCLISFEPSAKIQRAIDERDKSKMYKLSVYVRVNELDSDLSEFYRKAAALFPDATDTYMNAEYICQEGENVILNYIWEKEIFCFMIAIVLELLGMYTLKGAILS